MNNKDKKEDVNIDENVTQDESKEQDVKEREDEAIEAVKKALEEASKLEEEKEEVEDTNKSKEELEIERLNDKLVRNMAEFENFRKRNEKEKSAMFDMGAKHILEKILPIIDNFERGLQIEPKEKETKAFFDGMNMVYKQLLKQLEEVGVKAIDCVGKEFDLELHNAVMHIEDENLGENVVSKELQKGYMYKDIVLRHSMVEVAN